MSARFVAFARLVLIALILVSGSLGAFAQTCTPPTIVLSGPPLASCPGNPATFDAGDGWATYTWSTGATGRYMTDTPLVTTSYTVTVTDGNGCSMTSQPYELVVDGPQTLLMDAPATACPDAIAGASVQPPAGGGNWAQVNWTITGGHFYDPIGTNPTTESGMTVSFAADGSGPVTLHATATDSMYCPAAEAVKQIPLATQQLIIEAPSSVCPNGSSAAVAPPATGSWVSVSWTITNGTFAGPGNPTFATAPAVWFTPDSSGQPVILHANAWDGQNCSLSATRTIGIRTIAPPVINAPFEVCPNGVPGTASVAPPEGGGSWMSASWDIQNGRFTGVGYGDGTYASGQTVSFYATDPAQPVVLHVHVWDGEYCSSEATKTVGIRTIAAPVINAPFELCPNGTPGNASIAAPANGSWVSASWDIQNGRFTGVGYGDGTYASGQSVWFYATDPSQPVILHVRAWDSEYCTSEATKTVGIRTIAAPVINAPFEVCPNGTPGAASIAAPASGSWVSASWDIINGRFTGVGYGDGTYASGQNVWFYATDPSQPVILHVRAWDGEYCTSEATKTVGIRTIAPPVITAPAATCPSGMIETASVAPPANGSWVSASWDIVNGHFSGVGYGDGTYASGQTVNFIADASGQPVILHVRAWDGEYCTSEATKTVAIRTIAAPVITAPAQVCTSGSGSASVAPPAEGGNWMSVTWSITNGTFAGGSASASGAAVSFSANGSGNPVTLNVQAWDGQNCASQATKTIAIATVATPVITPSGPTTFCYGGDVQLTAPAGAAAYLWSTGATTQSIWALDSGTFIVTVTGANGCSATSAPITTTERPAPVFPTIVTVPAYCVGSGNAQASTSGGAPVSYLWQVIYGGYISGPANGATVNYFSNQTYGSILLSVWTTDAQGCTIRTNLEVPISAAQAPTITGGWSICAGGVGTLQVDQPRAGSTFQWAITNGVIDSVVNTATGQPDPHGDQITYHPTIAGGTLTVIATEVNAGGCSKSTSYPVTVNALPSFDFTMVAACPGGPGSATASAAPSFGQTYVWAVTNATISSGQGARTLNYVSTGSDPVTISLTVSNNSSTPICSKTVTKVSPIQTIGQPFINSPTVACPNTSIGAAVSSGLYDEVTWSVQNGTITSTTATSVTYTVGASGSVVVTAVVRKGTCTNSNTVTVPIANPDFTAPPSTCPSGQVTISYPTGYLGYSVSYQNAFYVSSGNNAYVLRPDGSGQPIQVTVGFQITVSANSCWLYRTKSIPIVQTEAPVIAFDVPANFCAGMSGSATITNRDYTTYAWTLNGGTITGPANGRTVNFIWSDNTANFTATVAVVDERGCPATAGAVPPVANQVSNVNSVGINKICAGQTKTLTASRTDADSYLWSTGATTQSIVVSTAGDYTVTTTKNGCSLTSKPYPLIVVNPTVTLTAPNPSFCQGSSTTISATYANGTGNRPWFELHNASGGAYLGGSYSGVFNITFGGSYYVRVVEDFNTTCATNSNTVTVTAIPAPPAGIGNSTPTTFCQGGSVTLLGPAGMSSYLWSTGATTQNITVSTSGTYSLTVTNSSGCTASSSRTVTVNPLPVAAITASGPTRFCQGGSVTLTASAGSSFLWSNGATTQSINVTQAGSYTVRVYSASGCQGISAPTDVIVDARPSAVVTASGPTTFCDGGSVTLTAPESTSYLWSTGATSRSIVADASGAYSVTVTNDSGCSATSTPMAVTENPLPVTPVVTTSGPTTFCAGGSVTLTAPNGFTYLWSNGGTTQSIVASQSGTYSVSVTNTSGCTSASAPVSVTANALPDATVTASGPTTFCAGGSVTLSAAQTAGASYLWSNGATTPDVTVSASGSYGVTVTSAEGCAASSTPVAVTVNAYPAAGIQSFQIYDDGGSGTMVRTGDSIEACGNPTIRLVPQALNGAYAYSWSTGATTAVLNVTASGTYTVTVTPPGGCPTVSSVTVHYGAIPAKPSIATTSTELCPAGGSVTLTAPNADAWTWSNGATTQSIVVTVPGSYTVRIRNGACDSPLSDPVVVTTGFSTITTTDSLALCGTGSTATLTANDGTSWLWSNGATTRSITVTQPGTYSVTTTNNGCTMPESSPVTVTARDVSIGAGGPSTFCNGGNVTLTASAGTSWLWSNGATTQSITITDSGTYGVTATFADGCTLAATPVTVDARQAAVSVTADRTTICAGGAIALHATATGSAGYTYQWYDNTYAAIAGATSSSLSITPSASGFVYVKVRDELGCEVSGGSTIYTVLPSPDATITTAAALCEGQGGSASVADAGPGTTYSWTITNGTLSFPNASAVTFTPSGLAPVTLTVTIANAGCSVTSSKTVTINALPAANVTASGPTTFCAGGSVTLTASAGASYLWSNGATTQSINVTSSGSYSVTVTSAAGCSSTSAATAVTVNPKPSTIITASGPTTFCAGGSVTFTAAPAASYQWSNGATTQSITVSGNFGGHTVTLTSADGCSVVAAVPSVTVLAVPSATITASGPTTFCAGGSVTLTANAGGASYLWSNGETTQSIAAATTGSYTVTVTNASGCSKTSAATSVTATPMPAPSISASGPTTFCAGGSVTLTGQGGAGTWYRDGSPYIVGSSIVVNTVGSSTYVYRITGGGCTADSAPVTVTVHPMPVISSWSGFNTVCWNATDAWYQIQNPDPSYAIQWTVTNGTLVSGANAERVYFQPAAGAVSVGLDVVVTTPAGCSTSKHFDLPVDRATPVISAGGPTSFCPGGSVTLTMPTAPAGYAYVWSNDATTQSITVSSSGTYTATYVKLAGSCAGPASNPITVTVLPPPSATITPSGPTTFCTGGSVTLSAASASSYLWSTGATTQSIDVTAAGSYSVTVTNASGCTATSAATNVTVNAPPAATITAGGPTTFCAGGSVTLTASAGSSYLWSNGATTQSINAAATGSYSVTVTNASGCSTTSAATAVTVNAKPAPTISASGPTTFCTGGSVTLTASAGSSYLWSTGATTQAINATTTGSYSVTVTNASGCSATSSATAVTVNALPTATISASGPTTFCAGGSVTLTASAGSSYLWSTGATTSSINVTSSGSYSVTVTNSAGCSATSSATAVTVNAAPAATISASGPTTFCAGGSVTLTASAGSSYLWSNGATTASINVAASGSYSVTVTNASGCSATSAATAVTVNAKPTPTISASGPTTFCAGGSVTLTASAGSSYLWSTGATTASINVTATGSYSVTVTNAAGCSATSAATAVTVNAKPTPTISASGPTTFCAGGSVTLTASAGSSYLWSTGATTPSINVTATGSYSVTVTNASGCSAISAATAVTVNAKPATPAINASGPTTFCPGGSVTLTAPAGFTYLWSTGATTQSINATATGNYSVTVTNASGCSTASAATAVTVNAATSIGQQPQNQTIGRNTSATLTVTASGTGTLTYQWYKGTSPSTATPISGATSSSYTTPKLSKGTYTYWVRVTGTCGLVNSSTATITVP